jgi:TrmH family RNA methyltransferase
MITSLRNEKVRAIQALQSRRKVRQRERRLVFEGTRLVEEALRAGAQLDYVLYNETMLSDERGAALVDSLHSTGVGCYEVSEPVLCACSDTLTPQGIVAVLPIPEPPRPAQPAVTLIADAIRDPGNLGTILRTALAAGVEQVILAPGTVDAFNPKVVRSAMGAHLHLPISALRWQAIARAVTDAQVWLAAAAGDVAYTSVDWTGTIALIVGGEGAGAGPQAHNLASSRVSIPMARGVESLNTAIAAAVILFEIQHQRRAAGSPLSPPALPSSSPAL